MKNLTREERTELKRYRKYRNLAGRIYEQVGETLYDSPNDRESFVYEAVNGLEANFQRNMIYLEEEVVLRAARSYC